MKHKTVIGHGVRPWAPWIAPLLLVLVLPAAHGQQPMTPAAAPPNEDRAITWSFEPAVESLQISVDESGRHVVQMKRTASLGEVGNPDLLVSPTNVILPDGTRIVRLEVIHEDWELVPGKYQIAPTQQPRTTQAPAGPDTPENAATYAQTTPYPGWTVRLEGQGWQRGAPVARLMLAPLRWTPAAGQLEVLTCIELRAHLASVASTGLKPAAVGAEHRAFDRTFLQKNVANPQDVADFRTDAGGSPRSPGPYQPGNPAPVYVIITQPGEMAAAAERLAGWLTKTGLPADVVDTKWIEDHYGMTGHTPLDPPAKVREFIVDAYTNYGIEYVLLAGDYEQVPTRLFRNCEGGSPPYWWAVTDFYYSDLDVDHNANGNEFWFERYVDYPPDYVFSEDVYVGRIPAKNARMIDDYLNKWFSYVYAIQSDYQNRVLYAGANVYGCAATVTAFETQIDPIANVPPHEVTKLYCGSWPAIPEWEPLSTAAFIQHVSEGQGLILHAAHSGYYCMGMGDPYQYFQNGIYGPDDVASLTNLDRYSVMYSLGCNVQPWNYDHAIGEDLVMDPGRGLVASVANSDVGWWSLQMEGIRTFTQSIIGEDVAPIAQNMIDAKQFTIWWWNSHANPPFYTPWGKCSVNLLGEPSFPVWTETPLDMNVAGVAQLIGPGRWTVTVTVTALSPSSPPAPLPDARVCLSGDLVYQIGQTNAQGQVSFTVQSLGATPRALLAMASAHHYVPGQTTIRLRP